jgi:hypothetical protein
MNEFGSRLANLPFALDIVVPRPSISTPPNSQLPFGRVGGVRLVFRRGSCSTW